MLDDVGGGKGYVAGEVSAQERPRGFRCSRPPKAHDAAPQTRVRRLAEAALPVAGLPDDGHPETDLFAMRDISRFCEHLSRLEVRHPGHVFRDDFFAKLGVTARCCAGLLGITPAMLSLFMSGKRGISAVTAVKIAKLCGTSPAFWLRLQVTHELTFAVHDLAEQLHFVPERALTATAPAT